ncbi:hypothetical protein O1M54_32365 [Streptomyces diastatochromogenes]|nr:hypothetical protein [Streptomyces diastatochromogenes]
MTAEHEGAGEYAGMDALMAAITGEPLPDEARGDAAYLSEHRSAEADVALLKDQLTWLAEALTGEEQGRSRRLRGRGHGGPARSAPSGKRPGAPHAPPLPYARPARGARPARVAPCASRSARSPSGRPSAWSPGSAGS